MHSFLFLSLFDSYNLQDGPFKQRKINGCPQIDKFATYSINAISTNKVSPRIGILGASTFPSERDFEAEAVMHTQGSKMSNRIDDVSASVNKQIKNLEVSTFFILIVL